MTAATITTSFDSVPMAVEHVILTLTDDETYTCKMSTPLLCQVTSAEDMGAETNSVSYVIDGRTITFHADGVSDKLTAVTIYGRL